MPFNPSKDEVLKAWDDLEAGKPVSLDMRQHLAKLVEREQEVAADRDWRLQLLKLDDERRANPEPSWLDGLDEAISKRLQGKDR